MKKLCILKAPAKLNLHLQVGEKRQDGFHDINSLFVMVNLFDEISARSLKTGNDCRIIGDFNCPDADNLIYKAWVEFCREAGKSFAVEFNVEKNIPSFAGLGGGSSDAAAALKILNLLFETGFSNKQLEKIGSRLGSDIPFFFNGPAALIGGRGDVIKGIEPRRNDFLLINPEVEISTADAYRWVDNSPGRKPRFLTEERMLEIYTGNTDDWCNFTNDFSPVLKERYNIFSDIEDSLSGAGAVYRSITGSGSAVFGLFRGALEVKEAEKTLQNEYKFVQKIKSLDRIPYAILE